MNGQGVLETVGVESPKLHKDLPETVSHGLDRLHGPFEVPRREDPVEYEGLADVAFLDVVSP